MLRKYDAIDWIRMLIDHGAGPNIFVKANCRPPPFRELQPTPWRGALDAVGAQRNDPTDMGSGRPAHSPFGGGVIVLLPPTSWSYRTPITSTSTILRRSLSDPHDHEHHEAGLTVKCFV